jgi:MYXO-CTERM domain-containing protein
MSSKFFVPVAVAFVAASAIASAANANIRITEVMSSSNGGGSPTPDWIEVTNYGSSAVDLTGWRMDDGSFNFAASVALNGISSIGAGESVIFIESAAGAAVSNFRTFWGGLAGLQVGFYSGSGVGFSSGGDGACLFNGSGSILSQVSFTAATSGSSFFFGWDAAGALDPAYNGVVSTVGTIGTQVTVTSSSDTGSLGTAIGVPAPSALALLGLAGLAGRRRR